MRNEKQLQNWIDSAPVVVFRSPVTEMDTLRREFNNRNIDFREIELSMANSDGREGFNQLKSLTGYHQLPQVFIGSKFTGGADKTLHSDYYRSLSSGDSSAKDYKNLVLSLGYAGVIPFVIFTILAFFSSFHSWAINANLAYGAIILTFIGAIHWGTLVRDFSHGWSKSGQLTLIVSILPSIIAWLVLIDYFSAVSSLSILISSFIGICTFERYMKFYPSMWYRNMRMRLSYGVSALLSLSLLSVFVVG